MQSRSCKAYAKINLTLDIEGKRDDGYHEIETIMHNISLCDTVTIMKSSKNGIFLRTNLPYVPVDERNIAYKAAKLFYEKIGHCAHVCIDLHKRIPVGAGMAGGSTDAAAVLQLLNEAHDNIFDKNQLAEIGLNLGADVPFCVYEKPSIARGIGEILTPAPSLPDCSILICKPKFSISTKKLYEKIDSVEIDNRPDTDLMIEALKEKNLEKICKNLGNVMEKAAIMERPQIGEIKQNLLKNGAIGALMTGSGSAVYGIFESEKDAKNAQKNIKNDVFSCISTPI